MVSSPPTFICLVLSTPRPPTDRNRAAQKEGKALQVESNPSMLELQFKQEKEGKIKAKEEQRAQLLAKYGGEEHLESAPKVSNHWVVAVHRTRGAAAPD